jgi:hypothetical protein
MAEGRKLFPNLRAALRANHEAAQALPPATFYRYVAGELPGTLEWFLQYPDVLEALLTDAREMSEEDWRIYRQQIRKRARAAKKRREKTDTPE